MRVLPRESTELDLDASVGCKGSFMMFVGHERLRNKSSGCGEGGCLDGICNAVLKPSVPSIDFDEARVVGASAVSAA